MNTSRRDFLKLSVGAAVGGGLLIGFGLPARSQNPMLFAPNAFLRIDRAGKVTFVMPYVEMGQGTYTSIPMLIAEESRSMSTRWRSSSSPPDDKIYANPLLRRLRSPAPRPPCAARMAPLRRAGATARVMLVTAAAQRWKVDPSGLPRGERHGGARRHRPQARLWGAR